MLASQLIDGAGRFDRTKHDRNRYLPVSSGLNCISAVPADSKSPPRVVNLATAGTSQGQTRSAASYRAGLTFMARVSFVVWAW